MDIGLHNSMSSGLCYWEKTSNGCKDEDEHFTHNAFDFYELCRAGERKGAEFQCKREPAIIEVAFGLPIMMVLLGCLIVGALIIFVIFAIRRRKTAKYVRTALISIALDVARYNAFHMI